MYFEKSITLSFDAGTWTEIQVIARDKFHGSEKKTIEELCKYAMPQIIARMTVENELYGDLSVPLKH